MLLEQQRVWSAYPADVRARLHIVVVDDCSPRGLHASRALLALHTSKAVVALDSLASFRIFRLLEKKRWNWLACRNLGARMAESDWVLLTDIDHVVPARTMSALLDEPLRTDDAYRFKRVTATQLWPYDLDAQPEYKPHNDSWFLTRALFFHPKVFGYDERLSGCYGTSGEFTDRLRATARATVLRDDRIVRYPREVLPDASTSPDVYTRKNDPVNDEDLRQRKKARAHIPDWAPLHGLTPWELVYSSRISAEAFAPEAIAR
jgi:hypothetical protein